MHGVYPYAPYARCTLEARARNVGGAACCCHYKCVCDDKLAYRNRVIVELSSMQAFQDGRCDTRGKLGSVAEEQSSRRSAATAFALMACVVQDTGWHVRLGATERSPLPKSPCETPNIVLSLMQC